MANALFPKRIEIDNASIAQLELMFTVATNDLQNYLFTLNGQVISKSQIMLLRQTSQQRIQTLGNDVGQWISATIPYAYAQGQHDAARQQSHLGDKVAAGLILGAIAHKHFATKPIANIGSVVTSAEPKMFDLHSQSVDAIMKDMSASFGNTLTALSRSVDGVISKVQSLGIRRTIAEAAKQGSSVDAISKSITDLLDNADIYGLVDKSGKQWAPDVYARMLTRTKLVEARNAGMMNSIVSIGGDLVQCSSHGAKDQCAQWEGKILSISGTNKYYESVQDAYSGGLFHPNCFTGDTLVSGPNPLAVFTRRYDGNIVIVHTASGKELSVTPNHPILTPKGWVGAGFLVKGDNVVSSSASERMMLGIHPNNQLIPTKFSELFHSFRHSVGVSASSMPITAKDFHGDGIANSNVDIVFIDRLLKDYRQTKHFAKHLFGSIWNSHLLNSLRAHNKTAISVLTSTSSSKSRFSNLFSLFRSHSTITKSMAFTSSSEFDTFIEQSTCNGRNATPTTISNFLYGQSGLITFDEIVNIEFKHVSTQVYNSSTVSSWYLANTIISHNCEHSLNTVNEALLPNGRPKATAV